MSNSAAQTCCFMNDLCLKVSRSLEMIVDLVSPSGTETSSCELKGIPSCAGSIQRCVFLRWSQRTCQIDDNVCRKRS